MNNIFSKIKITATLLACVFVLVSCNGVYSPQETSFEGDVEFSLCIEALSSESADDVRCAARTVNAVDSDISKLKNFVLLAAPDGGEFEQIGQWETYAAFTEGRITKPSGKYSFTLTAESETAGSKIYYKGSSYDVSLTRTTSTVFFTLKVTKTEIKNPEGTGTVDFTFYWSDVMVGATNKCAVAGLKFDVFTADAYETGGDACYHEEVTYNDTNPYTKQFTTTLTAGEYIVRTLLYEDSSFTRVTGNVTEVVNVLPGYVSKAEYRDVVITELVQ